MIKPYMLRLEGSTRCQLRCLSCPQTTSRDETVFGSGFLSLEDFRKVISGNPWLRHVALSNYGELFLNPELTGIIECATAAGVTLGAAGGANFNDVAPQVNWDGRLLGCCRNFWGEFGGNAFSRPLLDCLNGEGIGYARQMLLGKRPSRPDIPCADCDVFLIRAANGTVLKRGFLRTERTRAKKALQERLVRVAESGRRGGYQWHG